MRTDGLTLGPVLLLLAVSLEVAADLPEWPLDLGLREGSAEFVSKARQAELDRLSDVEMVILGRVESTTGYRRSPRGPIYTSANIRIDECVYGNCPADSILLDFVGGTTADGHVEEYDLSGPPWAGPWYSALPEAGKAYVLLVKRSDRSGLLYGQLPRLGYEIRDGVVVRKGIPVAEFTAVLRTALAVVRPDTGRCGDPSHPTGIGHEGEATERQPAN